mmetsp:Transcript_48310/g.121685  ORF Transcript_48310/g.121685 Transcript_48310/m.121685 type:complete len:733 (+) Transcript_48310:67-2265(+)
MRFTRHVSPLVITALAYNGVRVSCHDEPGSGDGSPPASSDPKSTSGASEGTGVSMTDTGAMDVEDDSNSNCRIWAEKGECSTNAAYMLKHCPKSCEVGGDSVSHDHDDDDYDEEEEVCSADAVAAGACKAPLPSENELEHTDVSTEDDNYIRSHELPTSGEESDSKENYDSLDEAHPIREESSTSQRLEDAIPQTEPARLQSDGGPDPTTPDFHSPERESVEASELPEPDPVQLAEAHQEEFVKPEVSHSLEDSGMERTTSESPSKVEATSYLNPTASSAAAQVPQSSAQVVSSAGGLPVSSTIPQSSQEWKGTVIAIYSVASALAQWVSVLAAEGGAFVVQAIFAEPPLNAILAIFGIFIAILSLFRSLPTGSGQHRPSAGTGVALQAQTSSAGDNAKAEGEILALRAQFAALQRQQEQTAADLQRYIEESKFNFSKISADMHSMQTERSSADDELCEGLKEVLNWLAEGSSSPLVTNGQSQPSPALGEQTSEKEGLPYMHTDRESAKKAETTFATRAELSVRETAGASTDLLRPMLAPHGGAPGGGGDSTGPPVHDELRGGTCSGMSSEVCAHNAVEEVQPQPQLTTAAQPPDMPQAQVETLQGRTAAPIPDANLPTPGAPAAALTSRPVPPALPVQAATPPSQPLPCATLDSQDGLVAGAGNMRPQPQEIKAASNPFGSHPQQQPIQASTTPFGSRPQPQPIQANSNPFGSRPQPQPIQASANPFGGPR